MSDSDKTAGVDDGPDRDPVEALAEEFMERYRQGERPEISEYTERYPDLADDIRELFPALVVMERLGSTSEGSSVARRSTASDQVLKQLGEYRILREVGRGGMGIVYEAEQETLGRRVALKVLPFHSMLGATHLERFRREARAAARLHHTNIVPVFGVGEHEGIHYYAMQFIYGQSLDKVIVELRRLRAEERGDPGGSRPSASDSVTISITQMLTTGAFARDSGDGGSGAPERGSEAVISGLGEVGGTVPAARELPSSGTPVVDSDTTSVLLGTDSEVTPWSSSEFAFFQSVARLGLEVADALAYANAEGILHRDIKPSNLLLDTRGNAWVTDFGLAKAEGSESLTHGGDIVGTLSYMAPERLKGWSDPRSDVYSLGVTLYEVMTLRRAFEDSDRHALMKRIEQAEPPRPRKLDRHIPRDLETIVLKAIEKEPGRRYQNAAEFTNDLKRFLDGEPIRARKSGVVDRAVKWARRRPAVATACVAVFLLVVFTGVLARRIYLDAHERRVGRYERIVLEAIPRIYEGRQERESPVSESASENEAGDGDGDPRLGFQNVTGPVRDAVSDLAAAIALFPRRPDGYL